jgi:hypothetical protein
MTVFVSHSADSPAVRANGTVRPSERPMMASEMIRVSALNVCCLLQGWSLIRSGNLRRVAIASPDPLGRSLKTGHWLCIHRSPPRTAGQNIAHWDWWTRKPTWSPWMFSQNPKVHYSWTLLLLPLSRAWRSVERPSKKQEMGKLNHWPRPNWKLSRSTECSINRGTSLPGRSRNIYLINIYKLNT